MEPRLFDSSKEFEMVIFSGGEKRCIVRFPSDEEWIRWAYRRRQLTHVLSPNKTQTQIVNMRTAAAELLAKIRIDKDGPEFDAAEARSVIDRLRTADVISSEREDAAYRIRLKVAGAETEHVLRMPKRADADDYADESIKSTDGRNSRETKILLDPAGPLYDKVLVSNSGYAGAVPIVHKEAAIDEVIAQIRILEEGPASPEA